MTQQIINVGANPNDGDGDNLRTAFDKVNDNFDQVWAAGPVGSNVRIQGNVVSTTVVNQDLALSPNGTGNVKLNNNTVPGANNTWFLGSTTNRWRGIYAGEVYAGNVAITNSLTVPGDVTVGGNLTVEGDTIQLGNITTDSKTIQLANTASTTIAANGSGVTVGANDNIATILYNSTSNTWNTNIGISSTGNVTAPYFFGNGSQLTGITSYANANVVAYGQAGWSGNIIPSTSNTYSLGNATNQWSDLYVSNATIYMNNVPISLTADNVLTVNGNDIVTTNANGQTTLGNLSVDDNNIYNTNGQGVVISNFSFIAEAETAYVQIPAGNSTSDLNVVQEQGNVRISASASAWTFGTDGNLTLPSNSFAVNYANGTQVTISPDALINGDNSFALDADGNVVFQGLGPGDGVNRGMVWDYGANVGGQNSQVRQDNDGLTVRAWTENGGGANGYSAPVRIVTNQSGNEKQWRFDGEGNLTMPGNLIMATGNIESATISPAFNSAITNITTGTTIVVVTLADNVFSNPYSGTVAISSVVGTTEANGTWGYQAIETNEFQLYTDATLTTPVDGTTWTAYVSGGDAVGASDYTSLTVQGGNVSIGSNSQTWTFDTTGSINIPPNSNSYDDGRIQSANGYPTLLGYGSQPEHGGPELDWMNSDDPANGFGNSSVLRNTLYINEYGFYVGINENGVAGNTVGNLLFDNNANLRVSGNIITPNNFVGASLRTNLEFFNWSESINNISTGATTIVTLANNVFGDPWSGQVTITDVTGATEANATWWYQAVDSNQFQLYTDSSLSTPVDSSAWGAYVSGGFAVTLNYSNIEINAQNITIRSDHGDYDNKIWSFNRDGSTRFPQLTVNLHNGGNQSGQVLQFSENQQAIITGPTPAVDTAAQRLIIQGQRGSGLGEGGDVYLWGGDSDVNGGDIKIYAGDADVSGYGGYINLDAGSGVDGGGQLSLSGGYSSNGQGGQISITPGYSGNANGALLTLNGGQASGDGGGVNITAGYGGANGGQVSIIGGGSALGLANYGNVVVQSGASSWSFDNAGNLTLPSNSFTVNYANGTPVSLGGNYSDSNVATFLSAYGSNTLSTTGNITAGNFIGAGSNVDIVAGAYDWTFGNDGNLTLPGNTFAVNYANGTAVQLGGGGTYGNDNVATFLSSYGSNNISTSGNITAGNISGNISITGNVTGTSANVTLVAGSYSTTFDNVGNVTFANSNVFVGTTNTILPNTIASFSANINSYTQVTNQNKSTGADATADYILTANNGNDTVNYGDFGIINSGYDNATPTNSLGNIVFAADTYLYSAGNVSNTSQSGGNLVIGTTTATKTVKIFAGGNTNSALVANISNTGVAVTGAVSATANITTTGNLTFSANTSNIVFNNTAYINGNGNAVGRDGSIMLVPYTGAGSTFPGVVIGGAGRLLAPNGSVHQIMNTNDVTFQVAVKNITGIAATSTTTGALQITGGAGISGNIYAGGIANIAGNMTVSGTGAISTPNRPAFRVYGNGVTSVSTTTNTTGQLNINNFAVDYNQGSHLNTTTGTFTAPVAGLYQVNLNARVANNSGSTAQAIVYKNYGSANTVQVMWESAANCTVNHFGVGTVSKLAAGDTLSLVVTVGQLTFDVNDSWSVAFVG